MIALHYSLLCRCLSFSSVASPSLVSIVHTASALSCQKTAKLYWRLSCVNTFRTTAAFLVLCKQRCSPPHVLRFSSTLSNVFFSKQGLLRFWCQIAWVDGTQSGIMSWLPETIGNADWSGAALNIIIITLKDLHWQRGDSTGPLSHSWAVSAPYWSRLWWRGCLCTP